MPAPGWFFRCMYDRESAAWGRQHDDPDRQAAVERLLDPLAAAVASPGPVVDLGCGPGGHALAMARRGYEVTGLDASPGMVAVARTRAERDGVEVRFDTHDVRDPLPLADGSLGGALAVLVLQHLPDPLSFLAEVRRCLRPGGSLLLTAPVRERGPGSGQHWYWRVRALVYRRVPGAVRFYDEPALRSLLEAAGWTVESCRREPGRVIVLART